MQEESNGWRNRREEDPCSGAARTAEFGRTTREVEKVVIVMNHKPITVTVSDWIRIPDHGLNPMVYRKIQERLVFTNPDYEMRHLRGEWIGGVSPQINCIRRSGRQLLLPRGFLRQFLDLCEANQQAYRLQDRRRTLKPVPMEFHGHLKDYQQQGADSVLERDFATLMGGHKSGKTVIALYTIAKRNQPTLVLIPRLDLLDGWLTKIENFLQIPASDVGLYAEGEHRIGKSITLAHSGEMMRHWKTIKNQIGYLIIDECQRCPSKVFTHLVPNFDSRFMLGLSNTAQRRDRLSKLVYYYVGDVVYAINEKDAREGRGVIQANVVARPTEFDYPYHSSSDYSTMLTALMTDEDRNRLIVDDIASELQESGGALLVLSGGKDQNNVLSRELEKRGIKVLIPEPEAGLVEAAGLLSEADEAEEPRMGPTAVLVSVDMLVESFDQLSSKVLFLAVPLYFRKGLARAIQSLYHHSNGNGGRLKIYDYVDQRVGLLENYFRMRSYNYGVHPDMLLHSN
jgi:superfamily II DNA or RNA helicase